MLLHMISDTTHHPRGRFRSRTPSMAQIAVLLVMLLMSTFAQAALNSLTQVELVESGRDSTELNFVFNDVPGQPRTFLLENPRRLILDFPDTLKDVQDNYLPYGIGLVTGVRLVEASTRTRVVVGLTAAADYQTLIRDKSLVLRLTGQNTVNPNAAANGVPVAAPVRAMTNVDFRRGEDGQGLVLLTLSDPNTVVDVNIDKQQIIVDLQDTSVEAELERLLDVIDFATLVRTVDTVVVDDGVRVIITVKGDFTQTSYQSDRLFTVEVGVPPAPEETVATINPDSTQYVGEKLSLNFQDIEIRAILQIIADFTGLNIVVSDTVSGNLTLRLKQVPWDHALDIILKTQGLAMRRKENIILVAPSEEIAAREKLDLESKKQIQELSPLITKVIQLKYAEAEVIFKMLKESAAKSSGGDEGGVPTEITAEENVSVEGGFLSARGAIGFVERTNSLIIQDTEARVEQIVGLLDQIDIPVRQVMVESRIVIATDNFSRDIGVQLGLNKSTFDTNTQLFETVGGVAGSGRAFQIGGTAVSPGGFNSDGNEQFLVDLPAANATSGIGLALLAIDKYLVRLELTAQQLDGKAEVVASPRLVTADRVTASIEQGVEIPFQKTEGTGADATVSIEFKEALLKLEVTPQITPDDKIVMDVSVDKQDPIASISPSGEPSLQTRKITSQVLVAHDETIILGGVYERSLSNEVRKVPFFGDLPVVGNLFKRNLDTDSKSELLIFLTPEIIDKIRAAGR